MEAKALHDQDNLYPELRTHRIAIADESKERTISQGQQLTFRMERSDRPSSTAITTLINLTQTLSGRPKR